MTDITERLRATCETGCDPDLIYDAADALDALHKDAERYRWWRENLTRILVTTNDYDSKKRRVVERIWISEERAASDPDSVDAATDAAMAAG